MQNSLKVGLLWTFLAVVLLTLVLVLSITGQQREENNETIQELEQDKNNLKKELKAKRSSKLVIKPVPKTQVSVNIVSSLCEKEVRKYSWPKDIAYAVMWSESGGDHTRLNDNPATRDYSVGCFQINLFGSLKYSRPSESWLKVPSNNVSYAYSLYNSQGRTFCTKGGWINTCYKLGFI